MAHFIYNVWRQYNYFFLHIHIICKILMPIKQFPRFMLRCIQLKILKFFPTILRNQIIYNTENYQLQIFKPLITCNHFMKTQILALFFCFFVATHSAILPESIKRPKISVDQKVELKQFASIREKSAACAQGKCSERNAPPKFKFSESLKTYVQEQYAKLKEKPSKFEADSKIEKFLARAQGDQKRGQPTQRQSNDDDDFFARIQKQGDQKPITPSAELARSLLKFPDEKVDMKNNARLLESMNNEYQEFDQGNIQANWGSNYTYVVRRSSFGSYSLFRVKTTGVTITSNLQLVISGTSYYLKDILVSNQVLIVVGYNGGYTIVYKFPLNALGNINIATYTFFFKYGYPVASREKNNRAIIVTQQEIGTISYYWYIGGYSFPYTIVPADQMEMTSGTYSNVARAVWNIGMNVDPYDYYFKQYLFADWASFINIGNTENLYIFAQNWGFAGPIFNIQIVQDVVTTPYGDSYPSGDYSGYVSRSFATDQYYSTFRVIAKTFSPVDVLYYSFVVPTLAVGPPVSVAYGLQLPRAVLFVNDFAYIAFNNIIKVTTGYDSGTNYPQTFNMYSLHKYTANASVATNYLIGFGYNLTNSSSRPVVVLYKISSALPLTHLTSYQLSQNSASFSTNYYGDHQNLLIDFNTKSIVFGVYNTGVSEPLVRGMYYLNVKLAPPCLFPTVCPPIPNSPPNAQVYKHWNDPGPFITAPSEMPTRFTIVQLGTNAYLYSSSNCQMQARQLGMPLSITVGPASRVDFCP